MPLDIPSGGDDDDKDDGGETEEYCELVINLISLFNWKLGGELIDGGDDNEDDDAEDNDDEWNELEYSFIFFTDTPFPFELYGDKFVGWIDLPVKWNTWLIDDGIHSLEKLCGEVLHWW